MAVLLPTIRRFIPVRSKVNNNNMLFCIAPFIQGMQINQCFTTKKLYATKCFTYEMNVN